jgi:hypothetical protein
MPLSCAIESTSSQDEARTTISIAANRPCSSRWSLIGHISPLEPFVENRAERIDRHVVLKMILKGVRRPVSVLLGMVDQMNDSGGIGNPKSVKTLRQGFDGITADDPGCREMASSLIGVITLDLKPNFCLAEMLDTVNP